MHKRSTNIFQGPNHKRKDSIPDKAAQETIFSVFMSTLALQSKVVSEQLMAAGATEEDVKKDSQIVAHTH